MTSIVPGRKETALTKLVLYETKARYILVGSDRRRDRFQVIKIDRTAPGQLVLEEDRKAYTRSEVQGLLQMMDVGNAATGGLRKKCAAYGLLGFVRFLHTYYILLITRRVRVGNIGGHQVYAMDGTVYLPITHPAYAGAEPRNEEMRYQSLFDDMNTTKLWFSYTYDLTNTLQFNMTCGGNTRAADMEAGTGATNKRVLGDEEGLGGWFGATGGEGVVASEEATVWTAPGVAPGARHGEYFNERFMWNWFLMDEFRKSVDNTAWVLPVIHGFFCQVRARVLARSVQIVLVARRSRYFAGTRYLKRGVNDVGHAANDVESEQILQNLDVGQVQARRISSFVQMRGSIPLFWAQESGVTNPKPDITVQKRDPFFAATALHFRDLFARYGSPVVVASLIKQVEKVKRETKLGVELATAIDYLNQRLPPMHRLVLVKCDVHRHNKQRDRPLERMAAVADSILRRVGFFYHGARLPCAVEREGGGGVVTSAGRMQRGVARVNCIDSLDRTNAFQLAMGKSAFAEQLFEMGLIDSPTLGYETHLCNVLIEMYDAMGNNLAMQYGGSELVNTIQTYRGNSWSSSSRDMLTTIKRYYNNAFTDSEKQHSINLFLGMYVPWQDACMREGHVWEMEADTLLHFPPAIPRPLTVASDWWSRPLRGWQTLEALLDAPPSSARAHAIAIWRAHLDDHMYKPLKITSFDRMLSKRDALTVAVRSSRAQPGDAPGKGPVPTGAVVSPRNAFASGLQGWVDWSANEAAPSPHADPRSNPRNPVTRFMRSAPQPLEGRIITNDTAADLYGIQLTAPFDNERAMYARLTDATLIEPVERESYYHRMLDHIYSTRRIFRDRENKSRAHINLLRRWNPHFVPSITEDDQKLYQQYA